ncbi:GTP cyclohydrolase I FolE2 [bacterium]|nr:GTP cyclohydrolase I FolE2 [candidate division CSSED10-310 bacterium]
MIDIQSQHIDNGRTIDKVGVTNLSYPIVVMDKKYGEQHTVATIKMFVQLPEHFRGTHMSRFLEVLNKMGRTRITPGKIRDILISIKQVLKARTAHIALTFPYFIDQQAPVSKSEGLREYQCCFEGTHDENNSVHFSLEVHVTVLNLCPCSRELSVGKSAHNQRSEVRVRIKTDKLIWIEDVVALVEASASSPVYTVLKRVDEKAVMDKAHDNPRFVEDIVREVADRLEKTEGIYYYRVESENFESIHHHNVYACIERDLTS